MVKLRALVDDQRGATAVEYALIIAAIAAVVMVIVVLLGGKVSTIFNDYVEQAP